LLPERQRIATLHSRPGVRAIAERPGRGPCTQGRELCSLVSDEVTMFAGFECGRCGTPSAR